MEGKCKFEGSPKNGYTPNRIFLKGKLFSHGSNIEYACHAPYTMDGTNILHCNDGFWNASIPSYILSWHYLLYLSESCKPLPLLSNGKIHNNGVSHGAVVSFSCNSGFQPQGSLQIKCLNGIWNESSPSCIGPVSLQSIALS